MGREPPRLAAFHPSQGSDGGKLAAQSSHCLPAAVTRAGPAAAAAAASALRTHGRRTPRSRTRSHWASLFECVWLFVADGCSLGSVVHSVTIALRHFALGVDPTAAYWDFDLLDGHGGWRAEGCHITGSGGNTTTIRCTHHNNFAVLMVSSSICDFCPSRIKCRPTFYGSNPPVFPPPPPRNRRSHVL